MMPVNCMLVMLLLLLMLMVGMTMTSTSTVTLSPTRYVGYIWAECVPFCYVYAKC